MNASLQSIFSLYKGNASKKTNSNCDILLSILKEPVPSKPVVLDFEKLNTHGSINELRPCKKCRKLFFKNPFFSTCTKNKLFAFFSIFFLASKKISQILVCFLFFL